MPSTESTGCSTINPNTPDLPIQLRNVSFALQNGRWREVFRKESRRQWQCLSCPAPLDKVLPMTSTGCPYCNRTRAEMASDAPWVDWKKGEVVSEEYRNEVEEYVRKWGEANGDKSLLGKVVEEFGKKVEGKCVVQ